MTVENWDFSEICIVPSKNPRFFEEFYKKYAIPPMTGPNSPHYFLPKKAPKILQVFSGFAIFTRFSVASEGTIWLAVPDPHIATFGEKEKVRFIYFQFTKLKVFERVNT